MEARFGSSEATIDFEIKTGRFGTEGPTGESKVKMELCEKSWNGSAVEVSTC